MNDDNFQNKLELRVSHFRAFRGQIAACQPTPKECEALDEAGITNARARSYLVWRRSCLVLASPFVSTSMILGLVGLKDLTGESSESFNALGNLMLFLTGIDTLFMSAGMSFAMHLWARPVVSMRSLRFGWLASFVLPLIPALFPIEMLFKQDFLEQLEEEYGKEAYNSAIFATKLTLALAYAIQLLPVVITFPGGAVRGALKILGLLPQSTLPGWILVVAAPFYSLLVCVALVIVIQVAGNGTLFFGTSNVLLDHCCPCKHMPNLSCRSWTQVPFSWSWLLSCIW